MSEQDKKNEAAAGLPGVGNSQAGDVDWRKRAEDTERELQKARVEQGRVKSLASGTRSLRRNSRRSGALEPTARFRRNCEKRFPTRRRRLRSTSPEA